MKDFNQIYQDIKDRFSANTAQSITENSVMDFYTISVADVYEMVYQDIESMRNPHLYSTLKEQSLDDLGFFMNMPRYTDESDGQYLFRLMNWRYTVESSNMTAINNQLLRVEKASDAQFIPKTSGSGTGTVYIIPREYTEDNIAESIAESMMLIEGIVSPSLHVDYVIPEPVALILHVGLKTGIDSSTIKRILEEKIQNYTNSIPPEGTLEIGEINRIGINETDVSYFSTLQVFLDGAEQSEVEIYQPIQHKFLLEEIIWSEE